MGCQVLKARKQVSLVAHSKMIYIFNDDLLSDRLVATEDSISASCLVCVQASCLRCKPDSILQLGDEFVGADFAFQHLAQAQHEGLFEEKSNYARQSCIGGKCQWRWPSRKSIYRITKD